MKNISHTTAHNFMSSTTPTMSDDTTSPSIHDYYEDSFEWYESNAPCKVCSKTLLADVIAFLECGHMVHRLCVGNWPETGKYCCPMCYPPAESTDDPRVQSSVVSPQLGEDVSTPPPEYEELDG